MSFSGWLLPRLKQIDGERTSRSVFHILRGKKSAQTFQDSQLFQLSTFFNVLPKLSVELFDQTVEQLKKEGYVDEQDSITVMTEKGKKYCQDKWQFELDGMQYGPITKPFYSRFQLLIQSVSHLLHNQSRFIPISDDETVQRDIKKLFHEHDLLAQNGAVLFGEVNQLFQLLEKDKANLMMLTVSGFDQIGLSYQQIAEKWDLDPVIVELSIHSIIHQWLNYMRVNLHSFQILTKLIPEQAENYLTQSALITKKLYNRGLTLDQIVEQRRLKRSTIEDHVVELAMKEPLFSIRQFVSVEDEKYIQDVLDNEITMRLKRIKDRLGDQMTYFQIRLVIARIGQRKGEKKYD